MTLWHAVSMKLSCLIFLLCSCAARQYPAEPPQANALHEAVANTVLITVYCGNTPVSLGSGVVISDHEVITARHVVDHDTCPAGYRFTVTGADGAPKQVISNAIFADDDVDAAKILVASGTFHTYAARGVEPKPGDAVCNYGWDGPDAVIDGKLVYIEGPVIKCGVVTRISDVGFLVVGMYAVPGNSGSGFWNLRGEWVGILVHGEPDRSHDQWGRGPVIARFASLFR